MTYTPVPDDLYLSLDESAQIKSITIMVKILLVIFILFNRM